MEEVWKDIVIEHKGVSYDFVNSYQVSNHGRVKSLNYNGTNKEKLLKIKPNKKGDKDIQAAIKETSKYSVKSSDFLTDDDEKNQEIVNDLEKGLYRKRMLSYGGLLKQKHKILNLDDAEDGNLINTSDEDKTTNEEEKAHSITAIWNFEKQNYYLKDLKR